VSIATSLKPESHRGFVSAVRERLNALSPERSPVSKGRVLSIDALRGFDMFWITGGGLAFLRLADVVHSPVTSAIATQLDHVPWAGFRFYDLIHPLFLFVVGLVMPISFRRRLDAVSKVTLWKHILKRVAILWVLGMVVQGHLLTYSFSKVAFYSNTLQTIAVGYLIASVLLLYLGVPAQLLVTLGLVAVYGAILAFVPVPGLGKPVLLPHHNLAAYLDSCILGAHVDGSDWTWILPGLSFGALVMAGVFACYILQSAMPALRKMMALFVTGVVLSAAGLAVSLVQPMIKRMYTSSYTLFSAGLCFLLMALFYLLIDYWKFTRWTSFFIIIGSNSIFAYVLGELYGFDGFAGIFLQGLKLHLGNCYPLVLSVGAYAVFWLILRHLYRQKIFIKI
jgi:predicted acyltransferase